MIDSDSIFIVFDLLGVFFGALTGALVARRLRYDITGLWEIALVSGLGGGIIRDICLQNGPPLALVEPTYLPTVLIATVASAFFGGHLERLRKTILVTDAIALATFAVAGSLRTFDSGLHVWPAVLLGVITAVGGGIIRDILTGETPMILRNGELYALAALGACLTVVLASLPRFATHVNGVLQHDRRNHASPRLSPLRLDLLGSQVGPGSFEQPRSVTVMDRDEEACIHPCMPDCPSRCSG